MAFCCSTAKFPVVLSWGWGSAAILLCSWGWRRAIASSHHRAFVTHAAPRAGPKCHAWPASSIVCSRESWAQVLAGMKGVVTAQSSLACGWSFCMPACGVAIARGISVYSSALAASFCARCSPSLVGRFFNKEVSWPLFHERSSLAATQHARCCFAALRLIQREARRATIWLSCVLYAARPIVLLFRLCKPLLKRIRSHLAAEPASAHNDHWSQSATSIAWAGSGTARGLR